MAFISDKHRLVFIHIPKNAGTTISNALARVHGRELVGIEKGIYQHEGVGLGVPPVFRPNRIDVHDTYKEIIEKYPRAKNYRAFAVISNPWERVFSFWKHKKRRGDEDLPNMSFADTIRYSNVLIIQPQIWWINGKDDGIALRKESLDEDWEAMTYAYGLDYVPLERLNTDPSNDNYRNHYDEYSMDLVMEYYRAEIERFGYEF